MKSRTAGSPGAEDAAQKGGGVRAGNRNDHAKVNPVTRPRGAVRLNGSGHDLSEPAKRGIGEVPLLLTSAWRKQVQRTQDTVEMLFACGGRANKLSPVRQCSAAQASHLVCLEQFSVFGTQMQLLRDFNYLPLPLTVAIVQPLRDFHSMLCFLKSLITSRAFFSSSLHLHR